MSTHFFPKNYFIDVKLLHKLSRFCVVFFFMTLFTVPAWSTEYVISTTNFETPLALDEFKTSGTVSFLEEESTGTYAHCVGIGSGMSSVTVPQIWIDGVSDITINIKYRTNQNGTPHSGPWVCLYIDDVFFSTSYITCSINFDWTSGELNFTPPAGAKEMRVELRMQGSSSSYYVDWDNISVSGTAKVRTTNVIAAATYYVSTIGDDAWTGTLSQPNANNTDGPFKTVQEALEMLRGVKAQGLYTQATTIILMDGIYRITKPIVFVPGDGGTIAYPLTIKAETTGNVIISGGQQITGWTNSGNGKWETYISDVQKGKLLFRQMFVNGNRAIRARSPNTGFFYTTGLVKDSQTPDGEAEGFYFSGSNVTSDMANWSDTRIIAKQSWMTNEYSIELFDTTNKSVVLNSRIKDFSVRERYIVENSPSCLDDAGEWCLDRSTGYLSYIPKAGENMATASIVVPVTHSLIKVQGNPANGEFIDYLHFEGIIFADADCGPMNRSASGRQARVPVSTAALDIVLESGAISAIGLRNSSIKDCKITRIGQHAIVLSQGCSINLIQKCEMYDLGGGGVYMFYEIPDSETPKWPRGDYDKIEHNIVDNCFIHDITKILNGAVGVLTGPMASYNEVTNNEICYGDYTGISIGWQWGPRKTGIHQFDNVVEYNHIHHMMNYLLDDGAGIYTLGWQNAAQVSYNWIHDIRPTLGAFGGIGIYPDQGTSGILFEGNIIHDVMVGFGGNGGHESIVRNNIFAFCQGSGVIGGSYWWDNFADSYTSPIVFDKNIIALDGSMNMRTGHHPYGDGSQDSSNNVYWNDISGNTQIDGTYARCLPNGGGISQISLPEITLTPGNMYTVKAKYHTPSTGREHYGPWVCMYIDNAYISSSSIVCGPSDSWQEGTMQFTVPPGNGEIKLQLRLQGMTSGYVDWDKVTIFNEIGVIISTINFRTGFWPSSTSGNVELLSDNIALDLKSFSGAATYAQCLANAGGISQISLPEITLTPGDTVTVKAKYKTSLNGRMHYGPWVCMYIDGVFISGSSIDCSADSEWQEGTMQFVVPSGNGKMKLQLRLQGVLNGSVDWDTITVTGSSGVIYKTDFVPGFGACTTSGNVVLMPLADNTTTPKVSFANWQANGHDDGSVVADPLFIDPEERDFRLYSGSPAFTKGFTETDLTDVGLYGDASWKNLPANTQHDPIVPLSGPGEFTWTYEGETGGAAPVHSGGIGGTDSSNYVNVVSDVDGNHLEFTSDLYVYYPVVVAEGSISFTIDIKLPATTPAALCIQFRDKANPGTKEHRNGPYISINSSRILSAPGMTDIAIPSDTWVTLEVDFDMTAGTYDLAMTPQGQSSTSRTNVFFQDMDFKTLTGLYIFSSGGGKFLIDNVNLSID